MGDRLLRWTVEGREAGGKVKEELKKKGEPKMQETETMETAAKQDRRAQEE